MRIAVFGLALLFSVSSALGQEMKVDGSSKEAYERSIKEMADRLSEEDKEIFGRGLMNLIVSRYPPAAGADGLALLQFMRPAVEAAHITLDGVSLEEILAKGREVKNADTNRLEATETTEPAEDVLECLRRSVLVSNARIEPSRFSRTIILDVTNNLPWAISGIRVEYVVTSEGRSVPWEKDNLSLSVSGGIEPGETRTLRTSSSRIPHDAPDQLTASMTVLDVADPLERQLIKDVTVIGWAEERSPLICE